MKKITINGTDYNIKYTIRALFIFEQITGKPFTIQTLLDNYIFFYSMILANNQDNVLDWDTFIDELDNNPKLYQDIAEIVTEQNKKDNLFGYDENGEQKKS